MLTFHILTDPNLNQGGSGEGHKPLYLSNEPKISG